MCRSSRGQRYIARLSTRARCPELVDIGRARRRVVVLYHHCAHACITGAAGRALLPSGRAAARGTPHTRTVWSSDADASMYGSRGFHATALTVPEWPGSTFCACKARQGEAARAKQSKAARAKQGKAARAKQGGACKARRRALRPGSPPGSTRSGSLRAVPGILGHPRPIRHVAPAGAVAKWASFSTWGETSSSDALCRCQM